MHHEIYLKIAEQLTAKQPAWLATVIEVGGSAPGKVGFKMLVDSKGEIFGTIGGGSVEISVIKKILALKPAQTVCWCFDLGESVDDASPKRDDTIASLKTGMICGGRQDVLIEPLFSSNELYIIGAGHCAQALSELAAKCDFAVTVIDDRAEFVTENYHPYANRLICTPYNEITKHVRFAAESSYIVVMTHAHIHDEMVLRQLVNEKYRYLGVIGSKNKTRTLFEHLLKDGYAERTLQQVYAPIGLKIGSQTPHEIAVSIMAQLLAVRNDITEITLKTSL